MKILLINTPQSYPKKYYEPSDFRAHIPIGLLYVASSLEAADHNVVIYDALSESKDLKYHYEENDIVFGTTWDELKEFVISCNPDVVGITNPFTPQMKNAVKSAEIVKSAFPNIPVIVGGPHASVNPSDFLNHEAVDIVVMGEGELTVCDLLEYLKEDKSLKDLSGVAFKMDGKIIINQKGQFIKELDKLPLPAYHLIKLENYFELFKSGLKSRPYINSEKIVSIITSRGCPYNCVFCSIHIHMGKKWRAHSPEYVINHIKHLKEHYNIDHVCFEDDNLTLDNQRYSQLLDMLIDNDLKISWDPPNGIRADSIKEDLVRKSVKSGCTRMVVGVESGDQDIQDKVVKKSLNLNKVIEYAEICKKVGIDLHTFFMIGLPGETYKNINNSFDFAFMLMKKYNVVPSFGLAVPLINTRLYDICKEKGYFAKEPTPDNLQLGLHFKADGMIKTPEFDPNVLKKMIRRFFLKVAIYHLLSPARLWKLFIKNPKQFVYKAVRLFYVTLSRKIK